jgi:hypothetical protein
VLGHNPIDLNPPIGVRSRGWTLSADIVNPACWRRMTGIPGFIRNKQKVTFAVGLVHCLFTTVSLILGTIP